MEQIRETYQFLTKINDESHGYISESEKKINGVIFQKTSLDDFEVSDFISIFHKCIDCYLIFNQFVSTADNQDITYLEKIDIISEMKKYDSSTNKSDDFIIEHLKVYCDYILGENPFETYINKLEKPFSGLHKINRIINNGKICYEFQFWWCSDTKYFDFIDLGNSTYKLTHIIDCSRHKDVSLVFNGEEEVYNYIKTYCK